MGTTPRQPLTVAAAQISSVEGHLRANVDKHLDYIERAHAAGVQVLVFPELSLTGYAGQYELTEVALRQDAALLRELAEAAGDMTVFVGYVDEAVAAQFYNAVAALRNGQLRFLHRKMNVPTYGSLDEGKYFATGRYVETFQVDPDWRASVLICADAWNPALVHLATWHGATMLIVPTASALSDEAIEFNNPKGWDTALSFYSMMYGMPVIMCNFVGPGRTVRSERFWGGSRVLDPFGREVVRAGDQEEELIVAHLDYENLRTARVRLPTVRDSNIELVRREIGRLSTRLGVPDLYGRK